MAGLLAARGLAGAEPDPAWVMRHASAIEGHPDNVAAAIYGGFVLAYDSGPGVAVACGLVRPEISAWIFVAAQPVPTAAARGLLPSSWAAGDAAANSAARALTTCTSLSADQNCSSTRPRTGLSVLSEFRPCPGRTSCLNDPRVHGLPP